MSNTINSDGRKKKTKMPKPSIRLHMFDLDI